MSVHYTGKAEKPLDFISVRLLQEKDNPFSFFLFFFEVCFHGTFLSKIQTSLLTNPVVQVET